MMLTKISLIAFLCLSAVNVNGQNITLGARDSVVGSLESFCYWTTQDIQPQFSTTCVTPSIPYPLSSSLDQFCTYFDEFQDEFQCRSVLVHNGGAPYPIAPGYENRPKQQLQQTIIFKTQPNGQQPIFFNQQTNQRFIFEKPTSRGPDQVFFNIQPQPNGKQQLQVDGSDPSKQIILNLNINPGGNAGNEGKGGKGTINIGAQVKATEPPSPNAQTTLAPPKPPTEEDLTALIFKNEGSRIVTRCPPGTEISWSHTAWTVGNVRPYYENYGPKASLDDCIKVCESREDCFFATFPLATRQCYLLTTSHPEKCNYHTGPHYGALLDPCTAAQPCPSAYKRCSKPNCSLQSIIENFCKSGVKLQAVTACHP